MNNRTVDAQPRGSRTLRKATRRTLLIVEPDDDLATLIELIVGRWGWTTVRESDAARVSELLRAHVVDVMLIDLWHKGAIELSCLPCAAGDVVGRRNDHDNRVRRHDSNDADRESHRWACRIHRDLCGGSAGWHRVEWLHRRAQPT